MEWERKLAYMLFFLTLIECGLSVCSGGKAMRTMGIMRIMRIRMDFQYLKDCRNGWKPLMEEGR